MDGRLVLLVGLGGAIGSILRYLITEIIPSNQMPYGTITVNLLGSMLLGIMFGAIAADAIINQDYVLLFGTGLLGAFTTMSAFAMDTVTLTEDEISTTFIYVLITIVGSIGLAWSGYKIGFSLFS
ncbi:MAG: fluoride efflux transporter CrcB [Candidatus Thalassarchaeaceae archaeon]|jgi:CrcB protein|nr:fluoride efflux transporter CrcB [Candidatus Thalassarchaeaceae archaeon]|tara:strand:+ start:93 stop:467 length:375 start_codon:yes stop_codon:yes gene_type:complete